MNIYFIIMSIEKNSLKHLKTFLLKCHIVYTQHLCVGRGVGALTTEDRECG